MNYNTAKIEKLKSQAELDLVSFRTILQNVIQQYENKSYHKRRLKRVERGGSAHPRLKEVTDLKDAVTDAKTATELKDSIRDYLMGRTHFKGAKLSPLRTKLLAEIKKFLKTHDLKTIDDHLDFEFPEAPRRVEAGRLGLDTESVEIDSSEDHRAQHLERALQASREEAAELRQQLERAQQRVAAPPAKAEVKGRKQDTKQSLEAAQAQVAQQAQEVQRLQAELQTARQVNVDTQRSLEGARAQIADLQARNDDQAGQIENLQQDLQAQEQARVETAQLLDDSRATARTLKAKLQESKAVIRQQQETIVEQQSLIQSFREKFISVVESAVSVIQGFRNLLFSATNDLKKASATGKVSFRNQVEKEFKFKKGAIYERHFNLLDNNLDVGGLIQQLDQNNKDVVNFIDSSAANVQINLAAGIEEDIIIDDTPAPMPAKRAALQPNSNLRAPVVVERPIAAPPAPVAAGADAPPPPPPPQLVQQAKKSPVAPKSGSTHKSVTEQLQQKPLDPMSELKEKQQGGVKLKKVDMSQEPPKPKAELPSLHQALFSAVAARRAVIETSDNEDEETLSNWK